ncbi:MAG: long-chain fatty acid--CoA ligase, partial [Alphaproteobacteria bacterium]|nr:long-chain fatty acid--CoA ligase [Alphaproteobacteria bacterium]
MNKGQGEDIQPGAVASAPFRPGASVDPEFDTFPKLLKRNASVRSKRPAMREKDYGIWQSWTWAEVADEVRAIACGLAELGLR